MTQPHTTSLGLQIRVVLLSYLTRPGFRWGLVGAGSACGLYYLAHAFAPAVGMFDPPSGWFLELVLLLATLAVYGSAVGMLIVFFWHARQQLMGPQARLLPHTRSANAIVAGALLIGLALLIASPTIADPKLLFFGVFIVALSFLTLLAWAFCNPWLVPIPAILMVMSSRNIYVYSGIVEITRVVDLSGHLAPNKWAARLWESQLREANYLRALVAIGDLLALVVLNYLARPRRFALRLPKLALARTSGATRDAIHDVRHPLLDSAIARSLHRRFAVHDWRAATVAALGIAGLTLWLCVGFRDDAATVLSTVLALLPGVLLAIGWRERWSILEFESLYPVSRRQFIADTAVGLLLDAAEFWLTTVIAALIVCFCMRMPGLHNPRFAEALVVGAMMQFVWVGGVFFIGQRRQTVSYIAGLAPFPVAIFATIAAVWRQSESLTLMTSMLIALAEAAAGLLMFALTWAHLQRTPRPNATGIASVQPAI